MLQRVEEIFPNNSFTACESLFMTSENKRQAEKNNKKVKKKKKMKVTLLGLRMWLCW